MSAEADPAAVLRAHYARACPQPFLLEPVDAAEVNSRNWIVSVNGEKRFVLKRGADSKVAERYAEFSSRTALLPPLVPAADGKPCARVEGQAFRLMEYREGHAFPGSEAALEQAARALAQLHLALRDVPGSLPFSDRYLPLEQISGPIGEEELRGWYAEMQMIESRSDLPLGWVHHDYHPGNVLFRGDRVSAILDMDSLGTDFRMQAVAFAASRFAGADPPRTRRFLAAYGALDPLTAAELQRYPAFVRREALRRINWILRAGGDAWRGDLDKHLSVMRSQP